MYIYRIDLLGCYILFVSRNMLKTYEYRYFFEIYALIVTQGALHTHDDTF